MEILNLTWLIPLLPLLAFVAIILFAHRERQLSHLLAIGGVGMAFLLAQLVFWRAVTLPVGGGERAFQSGLVHWLATGRERLTLGVYVDPLAAVMVGVVPLICLLIFIYSIDYMGFGTPRVKPHYSHFFCYLSLLAAGISGAVVSDNLLALFIFWELMGAAAYLLIQFWQGERRPANRAAAIKTFIVLKIGDLLLMLGLALLYAEVGSLAYRDIFTAETLEHLAHTNFAGSIWSMATVTSLLLFGGAVSASAQFPLHVWFPDAMGAPDPASALIHATTMSAGVFLMARIFPLLQTAEAGVLAIGGIPIMGFVGAFTALFSSLIALTQNSIKDVLAWSTIGQLGYAVAAIGVGGYVAGVFHIVTHLVVRTLLFLGSGSVIRGVERGYYHVHMPRSDDERKQPASLDVTWNMMHMGGLAKRMPRTFWAFLIGGLALSGLPLVTAGFWSNNAVLTQVYEVYPVIFWTLATTTGITACYTMRQICLTFAGAPRTQAAGHAMESSPTMVGALTVLAILTIGLGWIGIPEHFPVIGDSIPNWLQPFAASAIGGVQEGHYATQIASHLSEEAAQQPLMIGVLFILGGLGLGWLVYGHKPLTAGETDRIELVMRTLWLGWLYETLENHFYLDALYGAMFVELSLWLAERFDAIDYGRQEGKHGLVDGLVNAMGKLSLKLTAACSWFEAHIVEGLIGRVSGISAYLAQASHTLDLSVIDEGINGIAKTLKAGGKTIRTIQTGKVQNYLLLTFLMILALLVTFFMILFLQI